MVSTIYSIERDSDMWPQLLSETPDKAQPQRLYIEGSLPPSDALIVGVVGTRRPTSYGRDVAHEIAFTLASHGIVVASGLAIGIDATAHRAALEAGTPTVAILGSGISRSVLYPPQNRDLADKIIAAGGAIISEYEPDARPEIWTFPARNRIIAGIAHAVIVVEAGEKSGALITARFATEYGRDVFAIPGAITSDASRGTNALIKQGATPILSPNDILEALGIASATARDTQNDNVSPNEEKILAALTEELPIDSIIKQTGLAAHIVLAATTELEIRGIIKGTGGGMYRRV